MSIIQKSLLVGCALYSAVVQGSRKEIIPQYGAGFWFGTKAHPSAHIGICGGGCNAGDGPTDKQDGELFLSEALKSALSYFATPVKFASLFTILILTGQADFLN